MADEPTSRPGSAADLSRRMDVMEQNHASLAKEVGSLTATVALVAKNQEHQAELTKLRFDSLETAIHGVGDTLNRFMERMEGLIDGTIQTTQTRQGAELVLDYQKWRKDVDADRARLALLGRLGILLVSTNILAIAAALYAAIKP